MQGFFQPSYFLVSFLRSPSDLGLLLPQHCWHLCMTGLLAYMMTGQLIQAVVLLTFSLRWHVLKRELVKARVFWKIFVAHAWREFNLLREKNSLACDSNARVWQNLKKLTLRGINHSLEITNQPQEFFSFVLASCNKIFTSVSQTSNSSLQLWRNFFFNFYK